MYFLSPLLRCINTPLFTVHVHVYMCVCDTEIKTERETEKRQTGTQRSKQADRLDLYRQTLRQIDRKTDSWVRFWGSVSLSI